MSGGYEALVAAARDARDAGRLAEAQQCYREAAAVATDDLRRGHALRHVSDIASDLGHFDAALTAAEDARRLYARVPASSRLDLANVQRVIARALQGSGRADEAATAWREARSLYAAEGIAEGVDECDGELA